MMIDNDNNEDVVLVIGLRVFWNHGRVRFEIAQFRGCECAQDIRFLFRHCTTT